MARYVRKIPAPVARDYRKYRADVRDDFRTECAYCFVGEFYSGGPEAMELDHFRPKGRFPDLVALYDNIYYSCGPCNGRKAGRWPSDAQIAEGVGFVDGCRDDSAAHYALGVAGELVPLTAGAEYTIDTCRLNRDHLCQLRRMLGATGEFAL